MRLSQRPKEEDDGTSGCSESEWGKGGLAGFVRCGVRADQRGTAVGGGEALSRLAAPGHARHQEPQTGGRLRQEAVEAEGHGAGARRVGPVASVAPRRHGAWASAAQLRLCFSAQEAAGGAALGAGLELADGKLTVVDSLEIKEAKTKLYRAALDKLGVERTALLVENSKTLGQGLMLGARNLKGVELVLNNEVHPYDLLRYDRAIFSKAAIEHLSESLLKSVSKRAVAHTEAA